MYFICYQMKHKLKFVCFDFDIYFLTYNLRKQKQKPTTFYTFITKLIEKVPYQGKPNYLNTLGLHVCFTFLFVHHNKKKHAVIRCGQMVQLLAFSLTTRDQSRVRALGEDFPTICISCSKGKRTQKKTIIINYFQPFSLEIFPAREKRNPSQLHSLLPNIC